METKAIVSEVGPVTESQKQIIESEPKTSEILLVKAGPGSGKTLTMARRIVHLVEQHNIKPEEILVLSMTNRAVDMLKTTLSSTSEQSSASQVHISTFHSFCSRLLEEYGPLYDEQYQKIRLLDDMSWRSFSMIFSAKSITLGGKSIKGKLTAPQLDKLLAAIKVGEFTISEAAKDFKVSEEYLKELIHYLNKNGMKRYSDFIIDAIKLMNSSLKDDSSKWIPPLATYKIIIVDEFQDMHYSLLKIVKRVVSYPSYDGNAKHLTIAGDPNQCIYEFLGSNPDLFNEIDKQFPNFIINEKHILETFRLTPEVLRASTEIALKPHGLLSDIHSEIRSVKPDGGKPILYTCSSSGKEYDFIASEISRLILESGGLLRFSDFVVLLRNNKEVKNVANHFKEYYGIKTNKLGQSTSWITSKVHLFLDILNLMSENYGSEFCLMCVLMIMDKKPMSNARISKLFNALQGLTNSEPNYLMNHLLQELKTLTSSEAGKSTGVLSTAYNMPEHKSTISYLTKFLEAVYTEKKLLAGKQNPQSIMESLLRITSSVNLLEYLNTPTTFKLTRSTSSKAEIMENYRDTLDIDILSFYNSMSSSYKKYLEAGNSEKDFIDHFLRTYNEDTPVFRSDMVNVSTVHTAKGLEFPVVFIPASTNIYVNDWSGLYQDKRERADPVEARLFYVAATRAKNLLYVGSRDPLSSLSKGMKQVFTKDLPAVAPNGSIQSSLMSNLSVQLDRNLPSAMKVSSGMSLYSNFYQNKVLLSQTPNNAPFTRAFHIYRRIMPANSILRTSGRRLVQYVTKL